MINANSFRFAIDDGKLSSCLLLGKAKKMGYELAQYAAQEVRKAALTRTVNPVAVRRIADGVRVSRTSKVGEFSYGFASQRFSGGGTTKELWRGFELV